MKLLYLSLMMGASAIGPCDILAAAGNPCIAAHSTVRALYAAYGGPLYAVKNNHSGKVANVSALKPGGFADIKGHEVVCPAEGDCIIQYVFDQAGNANHLHVRDDRDIGGVEHFGVDASKHKIYAGNDHTPVYGMYFDPGHGYIANKTKNVVTGNDPETIYAVMTGMRWGGTCCFDYGNSETTRKDDGSGTMEAIYIGSAEWHHNNSGYKQPGCNGGSERPKLCSRGSSENCCGPWVGADLEAGMYYGGGLNGTNLQNKPLQHDFVSLMLKGRTDGFALKGGDATNGQFTTMYDGVRPIRPNQKGKKNHGYQPMKKEGGIILGTGGDESNGNQGNFYEGFMATGATSDATDQAVQANIVAVGYKMATMQSAIV
jgi:hypothetical protein